MELVLSSTDGKAQKNARRRAKRATLPQLLTRAELDLRSNAAKSFDRLVGNTSATLAARQFTRVIPLVCMNCTDPVGMGLVTSEFAAGHKRDRKSAPRGGADRKTA